METSIAVTINQNRMPRLDTMASFVSTAAVSSSDGTLVFKLMKVVASLAKEVSRVIGEVWVVPPVEELEQEGEGVAAKATVMAGNSKR